MGVGEYGLERYCFCDTSLLPRIGIAVLRYYSCVTLSDEGRYLVAWEVDLCSLLASIEAFLRSIDWSMVGVFFSSYFPIHPHIYEVHANKCCWPTVPAKIESILGVTGGPATATHGSDRHGEGCESATIINIQVFWCMTAVRRHVGCRPSHFLLFFSLEIR